MQHQDGALVGFLIPDAGQVLLMINKGAVHRRIGRQAAVGLGPDGSGGGAGMDDGQEGVPRLLHTEHRQADALGVVHAFEQQVDGGICAVYRWL